LTERGGRRPGQADYTGASRRSQAGGVAMSAHPSARTSHRPLATHRVARGRFVFPVERTLRSVETQVRPDGDQRTQHATGWSNRTNSLESDEHGNVPYRLLRQIPGPLVVLLDNGGIHRGEPVQESLGRTSRLHLEPFPPYAPELNPDEGVWHHLKAHLANGRPDTSAALMDVLTEEVCRLAASPALLRGCIEQSDLPPFLP